MKTTRAKWLVTLAVTGLTLTACGEGSPSGEVSGAQGGGDELTTVTVGMLQIVPSVGLQYGIEQGIFEKHGLDIELTSSQGGAAMLPAVSNQQLQIGVGNPLSVMTAVSQGLDMRIIAGYCEATESGQDVAGVVTRADSGIEDFADLEGQTVAINALKTLGDLTIMESVDQAGGDPAAVNFSEMPFPDMPAQLEQGNANAIWMPEPFLSTALQNEDNQLVGYPFNEVIPGMPPMVTFTSGQFAEENPEVVESFVVALTEALDAADADTEGTKALLPDFIGISEESAEALLMDPLSAEVNRDHITEIGELAVKYGFLDAVPEAEALHWER